MDPTEQQNNGKSFNKVSYRPAVIVLLSASFSKCHFPNDRRENVFTILPRSDDLDSIHVRLRPPRSTPSRPSSENMLRAASDSRAFRAAALRCRTKNTLRDAPTPRRPSDSRENRLFRIWPNAKNAPRRSRRRPGRSRPCWFESLPSPEVP